VTLDEVLKEVRVSKRHRKWERKSEWKFARMDRPVPKLPDGMVDSVLKEIRDMIVYLEPEK
jgi:hypothetical protein